MPDLALKGASGPLVLSLGANEGQTAQYVLQRYPEVRVPSFEPSPRTFERLDSLRATYKVLKSFNVAFGETNSEMDF
jgi:FkbM family methyltransferase